MANNSVQELGVKLKVIRTEVSIAERNRMNEVAEAKRKMASIDPDALKEAIAVVPALEHALGYTVDELMKNANGEIAEIAECKKQLQEYIERALEPLENAL